MTDLSKLVAGDEHYKAYVGPPLKYDLLGALQFTLLSAAGLRAHHKLCDVGCGSLRVGKLLIPYLDSGNYFGLEPNQWLIDEAIQQEIGADLIKIKAPQFDNNTDFELSCFGAKFDFIIAQSIFSHASGIQIKTCLKEVRRNLAAEGLFLATFIWGKADYKDDEWVYPGCVAYRPNTIKDWAWTEYGLKMKLTNWPHPNGQNWAIFYLPGNEAMADKVAHFNLDGFQADVVAIPEADSRGIVHRVKKTVKKLIK